MSLAFILTTIIGTLSHEWGHYIVAKKLGYNASIHYAYTSWERPDELSETNYIKGVQINRYYRNSFWIGMGGPLQTMLTGTIGLLLLSFSRRRMRTLQELRPGQWILVFLSLFWLRQAANFVLWSGDYLLKGDFSRSADEIKMAYYLELPFWSLIAITGIIGLFILGIVIFRFIPKHQRFTFVLAGITGGVAGYFLWLELLGPKLMP